MVISTTDKLVNMKSDLIEVSFRSNLLQLVIYFLTFLALIFRIKIFTSSFKIAKKKQ